MARIAYIRNLEEGLGFDKEMIYAAAVLHDIGKSLQYEEKVPHEIAGERSQGGNTGLLFRMKRVLDLRMRKRRSVGCQGTPDGLETWADTLEKLLYEATKRPDCVFHVLAEEKCNWNEEKKNMEIRI